MKQDQQHIDVFIAYSRKDADVLNQLRIYLKPLDRNQTIKVWYDGEITPGTVWEEEIKTQLHNADIILLLVSANSLASDYFYDKEMANAMKSHHLEEAIVVPVILSDCAWELTDLHLLQALPQDGKPIKNWNNESSAYANVVRGLYKSIEIVKQRRDSKAKALELKKKQKQAELEKQQREAESEKQRQEAEREKQRRLAIEEKRRIETEKKEKERAAAIKQQNQLIQLKKKEETIAAKLKTAFQAFENADYGKTISTANEVLQLDPSNAGILQLKANAKSKLDEQKAASLRKLKAKLFKFGLPVVGALLLFFIVKSVLPSSNSPNIPVENSPDIPEDVVAKIETEDFQELEGGLTILFPYHSVKPKQDRNVMEYLDKLVTRVKKTGEKIELIGHTDDSESDEFNMELGLRMAREIKNILVKKGVNTELISISTRGEREPVASNGTEEGTRLNRRVVVKINKEN